MALLGIFIAPALNTLVGGPSINQDEILAVGQILDAIPRKR
jgi:hypothetical protein